MKESGFKMLGKPSKKNKLQIKSKRIYVYNLFCILLWVFKLLHTSDATTSLHMNIRVSKSVS